MADARVGGILTLVDSNADAQARIGGILVLVDAVELFTTNWNAIGIPDPEGWEDVEQYLGIQFLMADGSLVSDGYTAYQRLRIRWTNVTLEEKNKLRFLYITTTTVGTLSLPNGESYSLLPVRGSYRESTVGGASEAYDVELEIETQ